MGLTAEEKKVILSDIVQVLRESERVCKLDFHNRWPGNERDINLLVWDACEIVRAEDGIDFGPVYGWPNSLERKAWQSIERRAQRQRARGTRAHKRAEHRMRLAGSLAEDVEARERINAAADRMAMRLAFAHKRKVG